MYDLRIANGFIVSGKEIIKADLYVKDGKVAKVTADSLDAHETYDAAGRHVIPGCVDVHVHFRDPGLTHKEDFSHASRSAAVGGVTTIFDMPNTNPPTINAENFVNKVEHLKSRAYVDYALWGLCLGESNRDDLEGLVDAGAIALKFYWGYAFNSKTYQLIYNYKPGMEDSIPPLTDGEAYELFEDVARTEAILAIHAENDSLIQKLTDRVERSGRNDYEALLDARPNLVEELTIQTAISFSKETGTKLHILHMTTAEGVDMVRKAQQKGLFVTAETCPHYLFLDADDYERVGTAMKVYPPVKRKQDRETLWEGLREGVISFVSSDHAPHTIEEKQGDLFSIPAGMCGVESTLPLMLNEVSRGTITLPFVVEKLAENPAKMFNLYPNKGSLEPGADADIVIVDLSLEDEIRNEKLHSKNPLTAFHGTKIKGWPVATFLRVEQIVSSGEMIGEPRGQFVKPIKPSSQN
jgi:allantoinase